MLIDQQNNQIGEILEELAKNLDVTEREFNIITTSYQAVGEHLAEKDNPLTPYKPSIHPQGSFLLGTVVRPISDEDDLDIDLVCELENKPAYWTQYDLKKAVGDRLNDNEIYGRILDKEGKRCWTLLYRSENPRYHLDVLPSIVCNNYREIVSRYFSENTQRNPDELAIHITDKTRYDYHTQPDVEYWMISNPFGYAQWFLSSARKAYREQKTFSMASMIDPVPKYSQGKFALQRVVQLLKRHRDKMFDGDEDKPISIIITTLATRAYNEEINLFLAFKHIAFTMASYIEDRCGIKWVVNPVNQTENFADRWPKEPQKQQNFYKWLNQLQTDITRLELTFGKGLSEVKKVLEELFGESVAKKTIDHYGRMLLEKRKNGDLYMTATGCLGALGTTKVVAHNFYGSETENA